MIRAARRIPLGPAVIRLAFKLVCFCGLMTMALLWLERLPRQGSQSNEGPQLRALVAAHALR